MEYMNIEQHITLFTILITETTDTMQIPAILMMASQNVLNQISNKYSSVRTTPNAAINKIQICLLATRWSCMGEGLRLTLIMN